MRERAGMTVAQAAERLGADRTRISNTESGRLGVRGEKVRTFAAIYECRQQPYVEALARAADNRHSGWWEEYRELLPVDLLDLAELEHHARRLRSVQTMHVPGLLQTEEYAKALFSTAVPALPADEVRRSLAFRMRRRHVLDNNRSPQCTFLVHEAALRLYFGGAQVMKRQLAHLLEESERENVALRVIPFSAGGFPNAGGSTLYASGEVSQLDTVQLDVASGVALLDAEATLAKYQERLDATEALSLPSEKSRVFVHALMVDL